MWYNSLADRLIWRHPVYGKIRSDRSVHTRIVQREKYLPDSRFTTVQLRQRVSWIIRRWKPRLNDPQASMIRTAQEWACADDLMLTEEAATRAASVVFALCGIECDIMLERGLAPLFVCIKLRKISKATYLWNFWISDRERFENYLANFETTVNSYFI